MSVLFSIEARLDLRSIFDFIARDDPKRARSSVAEVRARCELIADNPKTSPERIDLAVGLRVVKFGRYMIFYTISSDSIRIVRVVHGARDLRRIFQ